jgi:AcrR family transcriptional regulator
VTSRRERLLDAAIALLGDHGVRAVTHRAVDAGAGVPAGSASNLFRTRDALFDGIVERFADRERADWEELALRADPRSPAALARTLAELAREATTTRRTLTLARYGILVESARRPELREKLAAGGGRVNDWFAAWLQLAGSADPARDLDLVANYWTGLVLHELAVPDPAFDPEPRLAALLRSLIPEGSSAERAQAQPRQSGRSAAGSEPVR